MPVKRSRVGRSSSFGETDILNPFSSPVDPADRRWEIRTATTNNPAKVLKPSVAENSEQLRPRVLTLSSPVQESVDVSDKERIGGFLEKCYYCKKKMQQDDVVFMYSYLRAFCTAECRDSQIALDKEVEK